MRPALIFGLLLGASVPVHATTFGGGVVDAGALVTLGEATDGSGTGPAYIADAGGIFAFSNGTLTNGIYTASSNADVAATWYSADEGDFRIRWGWNVATDGSGLATKVETNKAIPNWSYTFAASGNGSFAGTYAIGVAIGADNESFGLLPIFGYGDIGGSYGGDINDPTGRGSFSLALVDGQTYTVGFYNFGNLGSVSGFNAVASYAQANFNWQISYTDSAVPEPGNWAMMIAGFGLVGVAARRANRRRTAAAA